MVRQYFPRLHSRLKTLLISGCANHPALISRLFETSGHKKDRPFDPHKDVTKLCLAHRMRPDMSLVEADSQNVFCQALLTLACQAPMATRIMVVKDRRNY